MAKPLRIGGMIDVDQPFAGVVDQLRRYADAGFDHAFASQIFGPDPLTLLAAAGAQVPGIGLGTGVVPVHPRHPMMLAAAGPHGPGGDGQPADPRHRTLPPGGGRGHLGDELRASRRAT